MATVAPSMAAHSILRHWEMSDINPQVVEQAAQPLLESLGIPCKSRDIFQLYEDRELCASPALMVISCVCPPSQGRDYLDPLMQKYLGYAVDRAERRLVYENMTFEAAVGQLPHATVISISRRSDKVRVSGTPSTTATLGAIPGYKPQQCAEASGSEATPLVNGRDLIVKVDDNGPLEASHYLGTDGIFNLVRACSSATIRGWKILSQPMAVEDYKVQQLMDGYLRSVQAGGSDTIWDQAVVATSVLHPHANYNTGIMWLFATAGTDSNQRAASWSRWLQVLDTVCFTGFAFYVIIPGIFGLSFSAIQWALKWGLVNSRC
ncbi:unnamed protein product [Prorocentrum cordatum]|uniref:Uncharacterized protein n=1 Tax=Prorocentrum cordatum TaxID=2364126 RepID=A0ABN9S8X7_9DINO|nr:unnamed protein product [Polarella glacialis]